MLIKVKTVYGDSLHIMSEDLERAKQRGRKLIKIYRANGTVKCTWDRTESGRRYLREELLHIDNIATPENTLKVYNQLTHKHETFTPYQAFLLLCDIGMFEAEEIYGYEAAMKLTDFMKPLDLAA